MAKVLAMTKGIDREAWLELRRKGLGGSDAAACVGLSPWKQPIDVYMDKIGEGAQIETSIGDAMYWGNKLEPVVADWFMESTGKKVARKNAILRHDEYPFLLANVDRLIVGERSGLEIKTTNAYSGKKWDDNTVPDDYYIQCLHYMMVTGLPRWYLAVLIGGNTPKVYVFDRDEAAIQNLMEAEIRFWTEHVEKRVPPPVIFDNPSKAEEILRYLYPAGNGTKMILGSEAEKLAAQYLEYHRVESAAKKSKEAMKVQLMNQLGASEHGITTSYEVSWKTYIGKKKFDELAFAKDHSDLHEQYMVDGKTTRTFGVSERKVAKGEVA